MGHTRIYGIYQNPLESTMRKPQSEAECTGRI